MEAKAIKDGGKWRNVVKFETQSFTVALWELGVSDGQKGERYTIIHVYESERENRFMHHLLLRPNQSQNLKK